MVFNDHLPIESLTVHINYLRFVSNHSMIDRKFNLKRHLKYELIIKKRNSQQAIKEIIKYRIKNKTKKTTLFDN